MVSSREIIGKINQLILTWEKELKNSDKNNENILGQISGANESIRIVVKLFNGSRKKRRSKKGSRKRFFTDQSQLDILITLIKDGRKIPYIAKVFKCSERTVRREIDEDEETKKLYFLEVKSKEIVTN